MKDEGCILIESPGKLSKAVLMCCKLVMLHGFVNQQSPAFKFVKFCDINNLLVSDLIWSTSPSRLPNPFGAS